MSYGILFTLILYWLIFRLLIITLSPRKYSTCTSCRALQLDKVSPNTSNYIPIDAPQCTNAKTVEPQAQKLFGIKLC